MSELIIPSRRRFLLGAGAVLISAPAIVRATNIMAVRSFSVLDALATNSLAEMSLDEYVSQYKAFQKSFLIEYRKVSDPVEMRDFNVGEFGAKWAMDHFDVDIRRGDKEDAWSKAAWMRCDREDILLKASRIPALGAA